MSITDELRKEARGLDRYVYTAEQAEHLTAIADRIDAEYESACAEAYGNGVMSVPIALDESAWVELPKDADGEHIHIGETVTCVLPFGGESKPFVVDRMELGRDGDGDVWSVALDRPTSCWEQPLLLRHYHKPTVEDVLREFALAVCKDEALTIRGGVVEEYAKRLKLAEGEDA